MSDFTGSVQLPGGHCVSIGGKAGGGVEKYGEDNSPYLGAMESEDSMA